jgi:hypothetical protein
MKASIRLAAALLLTHILFTGCRQTFEGPGYADGRGTLRLHIAADGSRSSQTVTPGTDLEPATYNIFGDGPHRHSFEVFEVDASTTNTVSVPGLIEGIWVVTVDGLNSSGQTMVRGSSSGLVSPDAITSVNVTPGPVVGNGTLIYTINWPVDTLVSPSVTATLSPDGSSTVTDMPFTIDAVGAQATYSDTLATGYYTVEAALYEGSTRASGIAETVRILDSNDTLRTIDLARYDLNVPGIVHYPLRASQNGRYLEDDHDRPLLVNGDAAWSLTAQLTREETDRYLTDRRDKGFNAIYVNAIEHQFSDAPPLNAYGEHPFTARLASGSPDFSQPNDTYWQHVDYMLEKARGLNILVLLFPAYVGYQLGNEGWAGEIRDNGVTGMRAYGEFLGNRYQDQTNILWVMGGDWPPEDLVDEIDALVEGIRAFDTAHLITAHSARGRSALDDYNQPWLDVNTTYGDVDTTPIELESEYTRATAIPNVYIEGRYEHMGPTSQQIRAQAYWAIVGGTFGHFFGNDPIWYFGTGWETALDSQGSVEMVHLANLLRARPFEQLVPDYGHQVVTEGYGDISNGTYVGSGLSSDSSFVAAYLPDQRTISVDLSVLSGSAADAWWYNPRTGVGEHIGRYTSAGLQDFSPTSTGDWVLVIDDQAAGYAAPGLP